MNKLFIGTSGYIYKDWVDKFYPKDLTQKEYLSFYAKYFTTVEINATFYRSFPKTVFEKWQEQTPEDFCFTIKGSRFITHVKRLKDIDDSIVLFFENASGLLHKLGVVLWQFPKSFVYTSETKERFIHFLALLPTSSRQVVELRHVSWFTEEVYGMLSQHNIGFVINDTSAFPAKDVITSDVAYIRFHGPTRLYASSYSREQLNEWASAIKTYLKKYDVYCYFNNDISGYAIENALSLKRLINY